MGLAVTAKIDFPPIPPALVGVALVDASTCAAAGGMSVSWWHEAVRTGRAPTPAVRQPRCTRWRLADVTAFWEAFAAKGAIDTQAGARVTAKAKRASVAAGEKRAAVAQGAAIAAGRP